MYEVMLIQLWLEIWIEGVLPPIMYTFVGATISWVSRLQQVVALSSTEAKYIALSEGAKEMIWLQRLIGDLWFQQSVFTLFCDSNSAIHLSKNLAFHNRTKHIELQYHFIRHCI